MTSDDMTDRRRAERIATDLEADVRRGGPARIPGHVVDMSTIGFRIRTGEKLPHGGTVWLRLDPLAPLMAKVMWSQSYVAGCAFSQPLHPAVLDHVASRSEP